MSSFFSRLYTFRERWSVSPMENFLTEALADLFARLPLSLKVSFVQLLLPSTHRTALAAEFLKAKDIELLTQVSAATSVSVTRPDMAIYADGQLVLAIEAKIYAGIQLHHIKEARDEGESIRNQLETYAAWVAESCKGEWGGAVVFLTGGTDPPDDFIEGHPGDRVIRSVRTWRNVGDWISNEIAIGEQDRTYCALASELRQFLWEQNLMTTYLSARDLATALLFAPSHRVLQKTFQDTIKAVAEHVPKLRGSQRLRTEFWDDANGYWSWFYFAQSVQKPKTRVYVAVGICFEIIGYFLQDIDKLPSHEPFFFVFCGDGWENKKPSQLFKFIPEGWREIGEDWCIISTRSVSDFSSDPDHRFDELKAWAIKQVESLTRNIPGYDDAPVEPAPTDNDEDA